MNINFTQHIINRINICNEIKHIPKEFITRIGDNLHKQKELKIPNLKKERSISIDISFSKSVAINVIKWKHKLLNSIAISVFISEEGKIWNRIQFKEQKSDENQAELYLPLVLTSKVRLVIQKLIGNLERYEIFDIEFLFEKNWVFKASSTENRLMNVLNITDGRSDYGWASEITSEDKNEEIAINFNNSYYVDQIMLQSFFDNTTGFPVSFIIEVANDNLKWEKIISESFFYTSPGSWHSWGFQIKRINRIRILILNKFEIGIEKFIAKILELKIFAMPENYLLNITNSKEAKFASEVIPGLVRLAPSGDTSPGRVVQGNDPRLWDSTTEYPGITRLARDREESSGAALQSNDSRLKPAQTDAMGIVQLAKNGENEEGRVLQSNDKRILAATESSLGIVQLAEKGESRSNVVVQGNDPRLNLASEKNPGIFFLAPHGKKKGVVTGDDPRLKLASISWPGIVTLASHNESSPTKVLLSDDPRLKEASEIEKGRVILARNGEVTEGKVIQSHDHRLSQATSKNRGTVQFSEHGSCVSGKAVESNDPRLYDARPPLPHEHDYAPKNHKFNDHKGTLNLKKDKKTPEIEGFYVDRNHGYPLSVENNTGKAAAFYGGALIYSEQDTSLHVAGKGEVALQVESVMTGIKSESKSGYAIEAIGQNALRLNGHSLVKGSFWNTPYAFYAWTWPNFAKVAFVEGDLLMVNDNGEITKAIMGAIVLGVYVKNAGYIAGNSENPNNIIIATQGAIPVRIKGGVKAGSLIHISDDPGVGVMVEKGGVAIALESNDLSKEKIVYCVLRNL